MSYLLILCPIAELCIRSHIYNSFFSHRVSATARCRRGRRIPQPALQDAYSSPSMTLYISGNDQALITLTRFDHRAFLYISDTFATLYFQYKPCGSSGGTTRLARLAQTPRTFFSLQCVGLVLAWKRTRGSCTVLRIIFGVVSTVRPLFLGFERRVIFHAINNDRNAAICMPSPEEVAAFGAPLAPKVFPLRDVYAMLDRLTPYLEKWGDGVLKNIVYDRWKYDYFVSDVFVSAASGCIIAYVLNASGIM